MAGCCVALIRASPVLLAAPSVLLSGSPHPSCSPRQRPADESRPHSEEECEEEGAEPAAPSQGLWFFGAPPPCAAFVAACKHAISLQQGSALCGGFPLSAPQFEGRGGAEGPAEQKNGLSCKPDRHLQALRHPRHLGWRRGVWKRHLLCPFSCSNLTAPES